MERTTIQVPKAPQNANEPRKTASKHFPMKPRLTTYLEDHDVKRFSVLTPADKLDIAKSIDTTKAYVHQILAGKQRIVSDTAQKVIAAAERKLKG